jgi:Uma2 family endonuclease
MATAPKIRAKLDDLAREPGTAELIAGRIVRYPPSGFAPGLARLEIAKSLHGNGGKTGRGIVLGGNVGFVVPQLPSGRESFSPDAAYYAGPPPARRMGFIEGPPTLAVEVRSEDDYGAVAERTIAAKRADYFAAGTLVVWDVDLQGETVTVYRADKSDAPVTFRHGEVADAEPAVPGWRIAVDEIF